MIRGYIAAHGGLAYLDVPSRRARQRRRRAAAAASILGMAAATGLLGSLTSARASPDAPPAPGPLQYIAF